MNNSGGQTGLLIEASITVVGPTEPSEFDWQGINWVLE